MAEPAAELVPIFSGLSSPVGMAYDADGNLFVAEWSAGRVTRVTPDGSRSTFAEGLAGPSGLTVGPDGDIYVASYSSDVVWRFGPDGTRATFVTGLATPAGIGFNRQGRLMIANRRTNEILVVGPDGTTRALIDRLQTPLGAVETPNGGYVVSNIAGGVTIIDPDGSRREAGGDFATPGPGITITEDGRVFVVDYGGTTVREINLEDGSSVAVADGLRSPVGLVVSPDGGSLVTAAWGDGTAYRFEINR